MHSLRTATMYHDTNYPHIRTHSKKQEQDQRTIGYITEKA